MRESTLLIAGAVVAYVLQIVLAPNIAILGAMPNFMLVYVVIAGMSSQHDGITLLAFFSGLALDLTGTSAVGTMAALFIAVSLVTTRVASYLGSDTVGSSTLIAIVISVLAELVYAGFYISTSGVPVLDALLQRSIPCALYDSALILIALPVLSQVFSESRPSHNAPISSSIKLR